MEHIRKIHSMGTAIHVVSIISRVLLGIGAGILLVTIVSLVFASIALPAEYQTMDITLDLGLTLDYPLFSQMQTKPFSFDNFAADAQGSTMYFDFSSDTIPCRLTNVWALFVTPFLQCVAAFVVLCFVGRFAKALKTSHSPFTGIVVSRLKGIGWSLLFASFLPSFIGTFIMALVLSNDVNLTLNIDLMLVLFVLLFLLLTYIFAYGAKLQAESDTTL